MPSDFYSFVESGHTPDSLQEDPRSPDASGDDVRAFSRTFYSACSSAERSDLRTAQKFYSKTDFILSGQFQPTLNILDPLLCEFGLLFEQDFDIFSDLSSFEHIITNKAFFASRPLKDSSNLLAACRYVQNHYLSENPRLATILGDYVESLRAKGVTEATLENADLRQLPLSDTERDLFTQTLWPAFVRHWKWNRWMRDGNRHYERKVNARHRLQLDQCTENLKQWKDAKAAFQLWKGKHTDLAHGSSVLSPTYDKCLAFIQAAVIGQMQLPIFDVERSAKRMCEACEKDRDGLYALYCTLRTDTGLAKKYAVPYKAQALLLFLHIADAFSSPEQDSNRRSAGRKVWNDLGFRRDFPSRAFFQQFLPLTCPQLLTIVPPLWLGALFCALLEQCSPHRSEYLAYDSPFLAQAACVETYKDLYANTYANYVREIAKANDRIHEYHAIWSDFTQSRVIRRDYLKRRLRYAKPPVPADDALWEHFVPVSSATGTERQKRLQKWTPALQLLLFENALQDSIREQAKQRLWDLITPQL